MKPWHKTDIEQQFAELHRLHRRERWLGTLQAIACGVLGLLAGIAYAIGFAADVMPWLTP